MRFILLAQLGACFFMLGLIWLIQLIHYPGFAMVEKARFSEFHSRHSRALTALAGPMMTVELLTGLALMIDSGYRIPWSVNFLLICVAWTVTFTQSVPAHNRLSLGYCESSIERLIKTNWLRTLAWTLRAVLLTIYSL